MPCDACGCACAHGGRGVVAPMEVDDDDDEQQSLAAPLLLDLEAAAAAVGSKPPADDDDDLTTATTVVEKMAAVLSRIRLSWYDEEAGEDEHKERVGEKEEDYSR
ncbi:Os11g0191100 [Oryza sativa Japonica Group]|uniref:Os11g0191100 protein n=1 Tax=Oryza sativa subsp. japonica TaxID=39947 RepID=A0A0P0Y059_ORYSJ|nr:Os11g0191100 [Oryza sativa Japonica Group]